MRSRRIILGTDSTCVSAKPPSHWAVYPSLSQRSPEAEEFRLEEVEEPVDPEVWPGEDPFAKPSGRDDRMGWR
jgi:hypothetical protein